MVSTLTAANRFSLAKQSKKTALIRAFRRHSYNPVGKIPTFPELPCRSNESEK
jgi:hypothetical protein